MAKIDRYDGNLPAFASSAPGTERTIFGDVAQANDLTSQINADFLRGWGIVGPADQPSLEDFNGAMYTHGQLLAYLHQMGVAEYNAAQEYHIGSLVQLGGKLYISAQNSNTGNNPNTSPTFWGSPSARSSITFTAPGVTPWVVPDGVSRVFVKVIGGGGGGGRRLLAAGQGAGGGGGGGGYSEGWITVTPGASINVTVGAGGAGSTVSNTPGANGATSSFGATVTASGGLGGGTASGAAGGVGAGGQLNTSYGPGAHGLQYSNSSVVDEGLSGQGGGPGGRGWFFTAASGSIAGAAAVGPGGGGGGAVFNGNGGNGGNGYVRVEW